MYDLSKEGSHPFKGGDDKKNLPSPEPLSQFKLNLVKTSLRKRIGFVIAANIISFDFSCVTLIKNILNHIEPYRKH